MIKDDEMIDDFILGSILPEYIINSEGEKELFDLERIKNGLVIDVGIENQQAEQVIESVVRKIVGLLSLQYKSISTNTVKDFICDELTNRGFDKFRDIYERIEKKKKTKFVLPEDFIDRYRWKQPSWGPLGYITFKRTYARIVEGEDRTEEFFETIRRVVEGSFSLQKEHCLKLRLPWDEERGIKSAKKMYEKMWNFKFIAPGRGLWTMGTRFIDRHGSMALNNCGFCSTDDIDIKGSMAFEWCMDALMLGVGVGFDTKGAGKVEIKKPEESKTKYIIPDSREGWVKALGKVLAGFFQGKSIPEFDYTLIRPAGAPIKGFGGVASGPAPLQEMLTDIKSLLTQKIDKPIGSADIVDIFNLIGKCVVAGNVRRCIAQNQKVSTTRGLISIDQVTINDKVLINDGNYKKVKNIYYQGIQKVIEIKTTQGSLICTPNHRFAVYNGLNTYNWKCAEDLTKKDRIISVPHLKGNDNIDVDLAWLIGFFIGDGNADIRNGGHYTVSFAMSTDRYYKDLGLKCNKILVKIGLNPRPQIQENSTHLRVFNKNFTKFMHSIKQPNHMGIIPENIWIGSKEIRGAFLAGLADADGGTRNILLNSKYPALCKQIQKIALSLGIATTFHQRPKRKIKGREKLYDGCHYLTLQGIQSQVRAKNYIEPYSTVWNVIIKKVKKNGLSLPYEIIIDAKKKGEIDFNITASGLIRPSKTDIIGEVSTMTQYGGLVQLVVPKYRDANFDTLIEKNLVNPNWMPIQIMSIEDAGVKETYDIEVEGEHEFICEGFLVHNSAEIALGSMDDEEFITLKQDPEKMKHHRWASNNSVIACVGEDYTPIIESIAKNGEPGIIWLENAQAYSRMRGEPDYKDKKVAGVNPCITGGTLIAVADGRNAVPIKQLADEGVDIPVYCKDYSGISKIRMMRNPRITGYDQEIYEVKLDDGSVIRTTGNHKFFLRNMEKREAKDLKKNDSLMLMTKWHDISGEKKQIVMLYPNVAELELAYNHKIVSVTRIGHENVYNGTVDEFHNYGIILDEKITKSGKPKLEIIFTANCGEQSLESFELCCLVETFPSRHETYEEFEETLKYAYLYAKSVTLQNTHYSVTNAVMGKNRRIGTSQSGIIDAFVKHGRRTVLRWCDQGYDFLKNLDEVYSDWLCIPKSIKITSVKPSGTVSLLPGVSPGIHYPHSEYYIRRMRIAKNSDLIPIIRNAGYNVTPDVYNPDHAFVIDFPIHEPIFERSKKDITIWEQFENACDYQKFWSDNQVSITITFNPNEVKDIKHCLETFEDKLKGVSLLPLLDHGYEQAPYEEITEEKYIEMAKDLKPLKLSSLTTQGEGEDGCTTDACMIKKEVAAINEQRLKNGCKEEIVKIKKGNSILDGLDLDLDNEKKG